jgi:hypothetical protein
MRMTSTAALRVATAFGLAGLFLAAPAASPSRSVVLTAALDAEVRTFLDREMAAHLGDIERLDPAPARVTGALTTGEFSWGTFMRALAAYAQLSGAQQLAGRQLARTAGEIGLLEVRLGGTRFSQLYGALALRHYGRDLATNPLWQSLSPAERDAWRTLLDSTRFYDPVKREVVNLPENYLGVAARIAAVAWDAGLLKDKALLDALLDRAAVQFTSGARYADDALPVGRYDRYSNEYARFVWEAASIAGRKDLLDALRPSLRDQTRLWWDLLAPDGYGYTWGRSIGAIGYMDTLELAAFVAQNPEFRPAPLEQIAAAYHAAWRWLRRDYNTDRHLLSVFDFGRGNFAYITREREWQQTTGFLGKLAQAHLHLITALNQARLDRLPAAPALAPAARFEFFQRHGRQAGVWVVRQGRMQFALPITTATRPGVADYLPAPHGFPGISVPVEQTLPALVPFLELESGETVVAADGADAIVPAADGRSLRATWTRWARVGANPAEWSEPGIVADVEWRVAGRSLTRVERLTASRPVKVRRWSLIVPATGTEWTAEAGAVRRDTFSGRDGKLTVSVPHASWPYTLTAVATGDSPAGRGARGPIPFHLRLDARDLAFEPGSPRAWTLTLHLD